MCDDRREAKINMMLSFNKTNQEINRLADISLKYGFLNTSDELYKRIGFLTARNKKLKLKIENEFGDVVI